MFPADSNAAESKVCVLVVDDDPVILQAFDEALSPYFEVTTATSATKR